MRVTKERRRESRASPGRFGASFGLLSQHLTFTLADLLSQHLTFTLADVPSHT